ncbi:MAG TPA: hypothetical protein VK737_12930 [Opitutales bacterium]|nr:hypothetical protein [Opitutales bacterium]
MLVLFWLGSIWAFGADLPPLLTPQQAIAVLGSSDDPTEIAAALEVAILNSSTRAAAEAYLDGPSRYHEMSQNWLKANLPVAPEVIDDDALRLQWAESHSEEFNRVLQAWNRKGNAIVDLTSFFAQHEDLAIFEVFKHYVEGRFIDGFSWPGQICEIFLNKMPPGSSLRPLFLAYVEHLISDTFEVGYLDAKGRYTGVGVISLQTNVFKPYFSPDKITVLKTDKEVRHNILGEDGPKILLRIGTDDAYDFLLRMVGAGKYPDEITIMNIFGDLTQRRYEPKILPLYLAAFDNVSDGHKAAIVEWLFTFLADSSESPLPPSLDQVDPKFYPQLLKFIVKAEKAEYPPTELSWVLELLTRAKTNLLRLYAQHGITPPTDAELAAMPAIVIPASSAASAPAKASTSAKPVVQPVEASPLPLYVVGGTIAVFVAALYLFRRK